MLASLQCTQTRLLLACHPPTQLTRFFRHENLRIVYFWYHAITYYFLFHQGPTSAAASTNVKWVFKSISNNVIRMGSILLRVYKFNWKNRVNFNCHKLRIFFFLIISTSFLSWNILKSILFFLYNIFSCILDTISMSDIWRQFLFLV